MSLESLAQTAARLASGSPGRTEADIQSDVRKFLLDAPLDLGGTDLQDVALEVQAGAGKRIDVEAGCAVIEVKKSLSSPQVRTDAVQQLTGYVKRRTDELGQRYVGVLTDGQLWILYHLKPDGELAEVDQLRISTGGDAPELSAWLEVVLATTDQIAPVPREILRRLGAASPSFQLDLADLRALYDSCRSDPEVQLKRELWARLLVAALGTNFDAGDELFVTHTYLVLTAELLAHAVAGISLDVPGIQVRALLEGEQFNLAGLHGIVEADFFDWPVLSDAGIPIVRSIARRLAHFDWSHVGHDVLKVLYESVIDSATRQRLGEYYTPDWMAERMVDRAFTDPVDQRLLDPACGSGTFLFWAVRRALAAYDAHGLSNREALDRLVTHVSGIDLHPVAVTLARVTYLLAIGRERLVDRGELTVPVFLGDSVRWEQDETLLTQGGITIHTSDGMELFAQELHFPEGVLTDPARFDRLVAALADRAANRSLPSSPLHKPEIPPITAILNTHHVAEADRPALRLVFEKLCRLHDAGRDHVWGYYVRNLARPLSFMRPDGQADVLVGNPPWLSFRNMPKRIQETYRKLAEARGLWAGAKAAPSQDLSDLFVARAVEQYLRPGGSFTFVMPFAVLSRGQFAGFRTGNWTSDGGGIVSAAFDAAESFAHVKPAPFPVPSCVVQGTKATLPIALPTQGIEWLGRVPGHNIEWSVASGALSAAPADFLLDPDIAASPYRANFSQGATLVPSVLVRVRRQPAGPLGQPRGQVAIASARSALEKKPWKNQPTMSGVIEDRFLYPMHAGSTIVAHRAREPELVIVPWLDGQLINGTDERMDEFPGLAAWWRAAERTWMAQKAASSSMRLLDRLDFQRLLRRQLPSAKHRVVYSASGQHLAACRLEDKSVIEHKLYWAAVDSLAEAQYLTGLLNSHAVTNAVAPLQSRGQHNPRDFDLNVFALPFPAFQASNPLHNDIVRLVARAETVAAGVDLDPTWQFQKARRVTREALAKDGVSTEIDVAVDELLATAVAGTGPAEPPLLKP